MATKRLRSSRHWEFIVKRKGLLATPLYLTFDTESEGDAYVRKLEALLDKGIVPDEFKNDPNAPRTLACRSRPRTDPLQGRLPIQV